MDIGDLQKIQLPSTNSATETRLDDLRRAAGRGDSQEAGRQLETLFGVMLVRELRRSMPKSMFGDGPGADVYEGWFDEQLGQALGERSALGIAGMVKAAIHQAQPAPEENQP